MVEVRYSSPAYPPYNIKVNKVYSFDKDSKGYFLLDVKNKIYMELDEIKMLLSPIDGTWDEILKTSKNVKKEEKLAIE